MNGLFRAIWANDICPKKMAVYTANHGGGHFVCQSIESVRGASLPAADLSWASFPCQDLSLAGNMDGIKAARSGLVWEWLRVMNEMGERRPKLLVMENVLGFVSAEKGGHYRTVHRELEKLGYQSGAVLLDAARWVPQSRPRVFVIAVPQTFDERPWSSSGPRWMHTESIQRAAAGLSNWIWWNVPEPSVKRPALADLIEWEAPCDDENTTRRLLSLISPAHQKRLAHELANGFEVASGYKRTRKHGQVLELRFDNMAGCLRTPEGGSSRQYLVLRRDGKVQTRLITVREAARLMGAAEGYALPGRYNDGYRAMGDAVAVPVVRFLAKQLLRPLAEFCKVASP